MSDKNREMELIQSLADICEELGWIIAIPSQDELVPGLIIGSEEFVADVIQTVYGDDVEIYKKTPGAEGMEQDDNFGKPDDKNKKKNTFH